MNSEAPAEIGKYRLLSKIGEGGMGAVYLAEHVLLGKRVAVKLLLHAEAARNKDIVARFLNEARAAARIPHPGIVEVFDCGTNDEGHPYLVMELLRGESLARFLQRQGPLARRQDLARRIGRDAALAVGAAHASGIIHRDLKPDNLFLKAHHEGGGRAELKVLDFGIAKLAPVITALGAKSTSSGALMGTAVYMSPEQCRASKSVDARSDVYSLGCILFEMVAGRPPFVAESLGEWIAAHLTQTPPRLAEVAHAPVDAELDELVAGMLLKEPAARPQSMAAVAAVLERGLPSAAAQGPIVLPPGFAPDAEPGAAAMSAERSGAPVRTERLPPGAGAAAPASGAPEASTPSVASSSAGGTKALPSTAPRTTLSEAAQDGAARRPPRRLWVGGLVAAAAVVGGVYVLTLKARPPSAVSPVVAPAPAVPGAPAVAPPRSGEELAGTTAARPPVPAMVIIAVEGAPAEALVTLDGAVATLPLVLPRGTTEHVLRVEAPGFETLAERVSAAADRTLVLKPRAPVPAPAPATGPHRRPSGGDGHEGKRRAKEFITDI